MWIVLLHLSYFPMGFYYLCIWFICIFFSYGTASHNLPINIQTAIALSNCIGYYKYLSPIEMRLWGECVLKAHFLLTLSKQFDSIFMAIGDSFTTFFPHFLIWIIHSFSLQITINWICNTWAFGISTTVIA